MTPNPALANLDARIELELTTIASIDAQVSDRRGALLSGDTDPADFHGWLVPALDRRSYAVTELVELRRLRALLAPKEALVEARLANAIQRIATLEAELAVARAEAANARDAHAQTEERLERLTGVADLRTGSGAAIKRIELAHAKRLEGLREALWTVYLEGETAVLHGGADATRFLSHAAESVPPKFRDDRRSQKLGQGYKGPRSTSEIQKGKR